MKYIHTFGICSHKRQADITLLFQYINIKVAAFTESEKSSNTYETGNT